jgi:hypothetical protein
VPGAAGDTAQTVGDHPGLIVAVEVRVIPQDLLQAENVGLQARDRLDRA